jgi:hypothetical protein
MSRKPYTFPHPGYVPTSRSTPQQGLFQRDFNLGIAAGRGCMNSFYDTLDVDPKLWPLLPAEHYDCDFSAGKILLVA